jgi:hypothetical protein
LLVNREIKENTRRLRDLTCEGIYESSLGAKFWIEQITAAVEACHNAALLEMAQLTEQQSNAKGDTRTQLERAKELVGDITHQLEAVHAVLAVVGCAMLPMISTLQLKEAAYRERNGVRFSEVLGKLLEQHPGALEDVATRMAVKAADREPQTALKRLRLQQALNNGSQKGEA